MYPSYRTIEAKVHDVGASNIGDDKMSNRFLINRFFFAHAFFIIFINVTNWAVTLSHIVVFEI